jgi:hypothetical protein
VFTVTLTCLCEIIKTSTTFPYYEHSRGYTMTDTLQLDTRNEQYPERWIHFHILIPRKGIWFWRNGLFGFTGTCVHLAYES